MGWKLTCSLFGDRDRLGFCVGVEMPFLVFGSELAWVVWGIEFDLIFSVWVEVDLVLVCGSK